MIFSKLMAGAVFLNWMRIAKAFLMPFLAFLFMSSAYPQAPWRHPLGIPYGDVTYEEWASINKVKKLTGKEAIIRQLSQYYEKDQWAAYIASEVLLQEKTEFAQKESNRLTQIAVKQRNPLAEAYVGVWLLRSGNSEQGVALIEKAAESGHPRALTIKAIVSRVSDDERLRMLKTTQDVGGCPEFCVNGASVN